MAGVSQATVSQVIRGTNTVSEAVEARVRSSILALGYVPNPLARGLKGANTGLFGVVARDISMPTTTLMISSLVREARARGYEVVVADTGESAPAALHLARLMKEQLCDGVAFVGDLQDEHLLWEGYEQVGLRAVGLLQGNRQLPISNVTVDNILGGKLALDHLTSLGHHRIAFVGAGWIHAIRERTQAFLDYPGVGEKAVSMGYLLETPNRAQAGAEALAALWHRDDRPTAIFAATDVIATGLLARAHELHVSVPAALSIIGFDDSPMSAHLVPALTTVHQPTELLARSAMDILTDSRRQRTKRTRVHVIPPDLVLRASTASPPDTS